MYVHTVGMLRNVNCATNVAKEDVTS